MSLLQPRPIAAAARGATPRGLVVLAARGERRGGGGGSSGGAAGGHSARRAAPPERLLNPAEQDPARKDTVYTLRVATGPARGAALNDPTAGVLVCLVGKDGAALLHRVPRLNDPETTEQVGGGARATGHGGRARWGAAGTCRRPRFCPLCC